MIGKKAFKFQVEREVIDINPAFALACRLTVYEGASVYLDTLYDRIPVWTGRLQKAIGRKLGAKLVSLGVRTSEWGPDGEPSPTESARKFFEKNMSDHWGSIDEDWSRNVRYFLPTRSSKTNYTFSFMGGTPYYRWNDERGSNINAKKLANPVPWKSQEAAWEAYRNYIELRLPEIMERLVPVWVEANLKGKMAKRFERMNLQNLAALRGMRL